MNENKNPISPEEISGEDIAPVIINTDDNDTSEESFGTRTVFIAGEDYDEDKPFLQEGFNEKKARKLEKKRTPKKLKSNYKKQRQALIALIICIACLAVACVFVVQYVQTLLFIDEADNTVYYVKLKPNPDYNKNDENSLKKIYMLCYKDGYVLDITLDGYYSTDAGTLVSVDKETGKTKIIAVVDTEGNEQISTGRRLLMFPHLAREKMKSIEVHNAHGTYTFYRDDTVFRIKGFDSISYDKELFSSLVVSTGYTITTRKINGPIKDENGLFSEYGLVPETRTMKDENGETVEYQYEPAWYVITDTNGNKHKVIVGDLLVTEGGYYVQYVEMTKDADGKWVETPRDAVYVVSPTLAETVLQPVENLVTPMVFHPMSINDYFDVEKFALSSFDYAKYNLTLKKEDIIKNLHVGFSFIPLDDRTNTEFQSVPYIPEGNFLGGAYSINDMNIDNMLISLCQLTYMRVVKLGVTDKALQNYGLDTPKYSISYIFNAVNDGTGETTKVPCVFTLSEKTPHNTYYATSPYFDMIVEIDASHLLFLDYKQIDWITDDLLSLNIGYCTGIKIESSDFNIFYDFDNSKSNTDKEITSDRLEVTLKQEGKEDVTYYHSFTITDTKGFTWVIDPTSIKAYDSNGTEVSIRGIYRVKNKFNKNVQVVDGTITDAQGNELSLTAETVTINGVEYGRNDLHNFRQFYKLILKGTIAGEITTEATKAELDALRASDDSNCMLKLTVTTASGRTLVYRFYRLTDRKAFLTINGEGNFFVLTSYLNKLLTEAQKTITGEIINAEK